MPEILARIKHGEQINHYETIRRAKDRRIVNISLTVSPIHNEEGQIVGASKIARDITEQMRMRSELAEEKERLRVTLNSIGDGVITTDNAGRVAYLNPVAEKLTGWRNSEAGDRPLEEVFKIINKDSRQPVENPATNVLREGTIVGLANISTAGPLMRTSIHSVPGIAMAIPETNQSSLLRFGEQDLMVTAVGTGEDFPQVHDWPPQSGVFFSADHVKSYAQVVVLGQTVVKNLFPQDTNPLGQYVLLGSSPFLVIGVLSSKGLSSRGDDLDNSVWLPYSTAGARVFGQRYFNNIVVRVSPGADMSVVQAELHTLLIKRHGKEDFNIRNMADTIATASETQNTLTYLLAAIAVISLVVGGIGVMNIMLVSVTERTREIGIRMAIGARSFDVLFQFLTEAVMVCFIGGLAGIAVGIGGGLSTSAIAGWRVIFTVAPIVIAFACAFLTGIIFGYLPARKAAQLDPIEALARD